MVKKWAQSSSVTGSNSKIHIRPDLTGILSTNSDSQWKCQKRKLYAISIDIQIFNNQLEITQSFSFNIGNQMELRKKEINSALMS